MTSFVKGLPHFAMGTVVRGFGRGSKELGIPTANFAEHVVDHLPPDLCTGIYYGWARVNEGPVYKMVMSVGWNPYYHNRKKSMETHIINAFSNDFYGAKLRVAMVGYVREEQNFKSLDELIVAIRNDIAVACMELDKPELTSLSHHPFLIAKDLDGTVVSESDGNVACNIIREVMDGKVINTICNGTESAQVIKTDAFAIDQTCNGKCD